MPQNAIIRADGTGHYTSIQAFIAAESASNYGGAITVGRVDGFFDVGSGMADFFSSGWPNGVRLEAFDSSKAFNGTRRQLCGITGSGTITLRNRGKKVELSGLEIYNTGTGIAYSNTTSGNYFSATNCLFRTLAPSVEYATNASHASGPGFANCVIDSNSRGYNPAPAFFASNTTIFASTTSTVGTTAAAKTMTNCMVANYLVGTCYRPEVVQTNCAATDATAVSYPNQSIAASFNNANPVVSGDYRIANASTIGQAGIGAFIMAPSNVTLLATAVDVDLTLSSMSMQVTFAPFSLGQTDVDVAVSDMLFSITNAPFQMGNVDVDYTLSSVTFTVTSTPGGIDLSNISSSFAASEISSAFGQSDVSSLFKPATITSSFK